MDSQELTVTVLHFDDEVGAVSNIPDAILHLFMNERSAWIDESELAKREYKNYVDEFRLHVPNSSTVRIKYVLTEDQATCLTMLYQLDPSLDIAIFDLMREDPSTGTLQELGPELYREAQKRGFAKERLFILSGFPNIIARFFQSTEYKDTQLLRKPMSAIDMARRIIQLFPDHIRL